MEGAVTVAATTMKISKRKALFFNRTPAHNLALTVKAHTHSPALIYWRISKQKKQHRQEKEPIFLSKLDHVVRCIMDRFYFLSHPSTDIPAWAPIAHHNVSVSSCIPAIHYALAFDRYICYMLALPEEKFILISMCADLPYVWVTGSNESS